MFSIDNIDLDRSVTIKNEDIHVSEFVDMMTDQVHIFVINLSAINPEDFQSDDLLAITIENDYYDVVEHKFQIFDDKVLLWFLT